VAGTNGSHESGVSPDVSLGYSYDCLGRVASVTNSYLGPTTYGYDAVGNLAWTAASGGPCHTYSYNAQNRLVTLLVANDSGTVFRSYYYTLGLTGLRTNTFESNGAAFYRQVVDDYDHNYGSGPAPARVSRLTRETFTNNVVGASGAETNVYDAVGNRITYARGFGFTPQWPLANQTFAFDHRDQIDSDGVPNNANTNYDANGNTLVHLGVPTGDLYDAENRLIATGSGVTMAYDADGNRVSKTVGGTTILYLVDDLNPSGYPQVLAEYNATTGVALYATYAWGLNLISETNESGTLLFPCYDGGGTVRQLMTPGSSLAYLDYDGYSLEADDFDYSAWGSLLGSIGGDTNRYLYAGKQWDPDVQMYYNDARYYNPELGRFWTSDTSEGDQKDPLSLHKYLYCRADPVNRIDPSGCDDISLGSVLTAGAIGASFGAVGSVAGSLAMGQAVTVNSVVQGIIIGAVLGPGALVPSAALGLGVGGVLVGGSYLPIFTDPNATTIQKISAITIFLTSVYGADQGLKYSHLATQTQSLVPESYMNPKLIVDMRNAPAGSSENAAGFPRNRVWFWNEMLRDNIDLFSPNNRGLIAGGRSPIVDQQWIQHFPQHAAYEGDTLVHHHIDQGPIATPLPEKVHQAWSGALHPNPN